MRSLNDEAKTLIEMNGGRIIHIDRQLYATDAKPIVGSIVHRRRERRAHTAPHPAIMHAHAEIGRVVLPTAEPSEARLPDNLVVNRSHNSSFAGGVF